MTVSTAYAQSSAYTTMARLLRDSDSAAQSRRAAAGGGPVSDGPAVVVELSPQAQAAAARDKDPVSYYAQFFPTRDGTPASALAASTSDPGSTSSSTGKTFEEVAADARDRMDAKYAEMAADGEPFDYDSFQGRDWYSLMGDLDRRSLHAVASNAEGLFTAEEQDVAQSIMVQQQGLAMGLYSGPTDRKGDFVDPFAGDHGERMMASMAFLDQVSDEEKTSIAWASSRASAQLSYEWGTGGRRGLAQSLDSDVPLARLLTSAMDTMRTDPSRGGTRGRLSTVEDLTRQPWFRGFEDRLAGTIRATEEMFGIAR